MDGNSVDQVLHHQSISRICIDYAVEFHMDSGAQLRLECPFRVRWEGANNSCEVVPERLSKKGSDVVVGLLHRHIDGGVVHDSGRLTLTFSDGAILECEPDDNYEAWSVVDTSGARTVCLPGGGISHWDAEPT